jgi:Zinc-finger of C2H2 type
LQSSKAFDKFPPVKIQPEVVTKLNDASGQGHGVFLPLSALRTMKSNTIVQRPPLQIIQRINIEFSQDQIPQMSKPQHSGKRKQQFKLTREDGVVFLADMDECTETKRPKLDDDPLEPAPSAPENIPEISVKVFPTLDAIDLDVWESTDGGEDTDVASEIGDATKQKCPHCNKSFKNLSNHKCRKDPLALCCLSTCSVCKQTFNSELELSDHLRSNHNMVCASCKKSYKTKRGYDEHKKVCSGPKPIGKAMREKVKKPAEDEPQKKVLRSTKSLIDVKRVKSFK